MPRHATERHGMAQAWFGSLCHAHTHTHSLSISLSLSPSLPLPLYVFVCACVMPKKFRQTKQCSPCTSLHLPTAPRNPDAHALNRLRLRACARARARRPDNFKACTNCSPCLCAAHSAAATPLTSSSTFDPSPSTSHCICWCTIVVYPTPSHHITSRHNPSVWSSTVPPLPAPACPTAALRIPIQSRPCPAPSHAVARLHKWTGNSGSSKFG